MKKIGLIVLAALLCLPMGSLATGTQSPEPGTQTPQTNGQIASRWAKGTVQASDGVDVFAPVGGQVMSLDLEVGDALEEGQPLMSLRPQYLLAPYGGVIRILHAQVGDTAQQVAGQYGALCYLERTDVFWTHTNVKTAHDKAENRDIIVGETLRVYNGKSNDSKETVGRVVAVEGGDFVVEYPADVFDPEDDVKFYRGTGDTYKDKDLVGKGKAERVPPIALTAEGVVAAVLVEEGATVSRGDELFILDSQSARYEQTPQTEIQAPAAGVVSALHVQAGQQAVQHQLLLSIDSLETLECVVDVDELDIETLSVGQSVRVKLDAWPDQLISATVQEISPRGTTVLDTTKYPVTLTFPAPVEGMLPGMHATAYWD